MKLIDLHPTFVGAGGPDISDQDGNPIPVREGIGLRFDCPCGCGRPCYVPFANPLDGGPARTDSHAVWQRDGETFETLTLAPSILRSKEKGGCGWHGWIRDGEVIGA